MAKRVNITLIDDLDGVARADETVEFELDGVGYHIDLSSENAERLRDELSVWIGRARRTRLLERDGKKNGRRTALDRRRSEAIRDWARRNGHTVAAHGRISAQVIDAYIRAASPTGQVPRAQS
ncbi:histone-like nucleoid-structuring protein Lsr2 [Mycobacteroides salmoniphilum]|uniref:Nucleoid-associated protein Lsr2 n=1 Tax=Mycobacteroides salmoniphilum TaxID=404941 RepID=A0A4R8SEW5_9MYCO|nr:Lsr2 family protein [Mycobacteroides salmoniphilum]TDZ95312.1 Nucleoid-associated protein Lsr2 [Mycobacteroides salmoniphilum]TEA04408.1 Nucleoid-associated protein Lsr2 [Mycobacteroides salmoniphilum]